tara:strand:- start:1344 stop:2342 length:999 start_codon:yes stop_codon:yes gene_type:complete
MTIISTTITILSISYLAVLAANKMKVPKTITLIVVGIFLGFPSIQSLVIGKDTNYIFSIADIGLLSLMYLAGLNSSWDVMLSERKDAAIIAIFAAIVPFFLGFGVFMLLGFSSLTALIVGISMSVTAEATKSRILIELDKLKSRIGAAMMGAGIVDDIAAMVLFIFVTFMVGVSDIKQNAVLEGAVIAFFIGILVQKNIGRTNKAVELISKILTIVVIPFFFISMGIHFDLASIISFPGLFIIVLCVAIIGKLGGTFLALPFTHFSWKQHYLIGWAMNSRGAVEIAISIIAFRLGLISSDLYSALIAMALVTTMIFPIVIANMVRTDPKIMD